MKKQTYEEVVDNLASTVKLKCTKTHKGSFNIGPGQIAGYSYKKGDVLPRIKIILNPKYWEIHKT